MPKEESVTMWIDAVRRGNALAAEQLWNRYFRQLMEHARRKMTNVDRSDYDEEDAALSTFNLLCSKFHEGKYPALSGRTELWQLMVAVLTRKIGRRVKYQRAAKRCDAHPTQVRTLVEDIPAPYSQELSLGCFELISKLGNPNLEQIALLKLEGYTNDEIASKLNRTRRTVQRMLNLIRNIWQEVLDDVAN